ncbi:MAG: DUF4249 family protein [Fermentimonas sp.]|jgi:hypothetical protein
MIQSKYSKYPLLLLALLFATAACEKVITLDTERYIPKIVMNGILSPDSLIEIKVSKSFLYTDTTPNRNLMERASLTLFVNNMEVEKLRMVRVDTIKGHDRLFDYTALVSVYRSSVYPKAGDRVRVEASAVGYPTAWAETTVPIPPVIHSVDTATFITKRSIIKNDPHTPPTEAKAFQNMRIKMEVSGGTPNANQHFLLQARIMTEEIEKYPNIPTRYLYLFTDDDPIFEESHRHSLVEDVITEGAELKGVRQYDSALFSNKRFRDNRYTLDFSVSNFYCYHITYEEQEWGLPVKKELFLNPPIEVLFTAVSPELYPYYKRRYDDPNSDRESIQTISEPELTYSNVKNGIGVVGAIASAKARIKIPPYPFEEVEP